MTLSGRVRESELSSTPVIFGTLEDIEARLAWAHEARIFTPWLADNLDRLSQAVGIPLELTGREVSVGRYSADILATNPVDGSVVLIENQLEPSDHTHLGQIMTYLAGLEAQVMIWIAPAFREEHLSALRWLNQHTAENFAFFAVRLRVVRIGDSSLAPLFDVLEKPNTWDKSLQRTARAATANATSPEVSGRRDDLWSQYAMRDPEVEFDQRVGPGGSVRWRAVPGTGVVVSRYVSRNGVGVFLRGLRGKGGEITLARFEAVAEAIEGDLGVKLGSSDFPFATRFAVDWNDVSSIEEAAVWLMKQTDRYVSAAALHLKSELDP